MGMVEIDNDLLSRIFFALGWAVGAASKQGEKYLVELFHKTAGDLNVAAGLPPTPTLPGVVPHNNS